MSDLSRRGFLTRLAALAATSALVPPAAALAPPPVMDDVAFIQGLIDAAFAGSKRGVRIPAGIYRVGTVSLRLPPAPFLIEGEHA